MKHLPSLGVHSNPRRSLLYVLMASLLLLLMISPAQAQATFPARAKAASAAYDFDYLSTGTGQRTDKVSAGGTVSLTLQHLDDVGSSFGCPTTWDWGSNVTNYRVTYNIALRSNPTFITHMFDWVSGDATSHTVNLSIDANNSSVGWMYATAVVQVYCKGSLWPETKTSRAFPILLNPAGILTVTPSAVYAGSPVQVTVNALDTWPDASYGHDTSEAATCAIQHKRLVLSAFIPNSGVYFQQTVWDFVGGMEFDSLASTTYTPPNNGATSITASVFWTCNSIGGLYYEYTVPLTVTWVSAAPAVASLGQPITITLQNLSASTLSNHCSFSFVSNRAAGIDTFSPSTITPSTATAATNVTSNVAGTGLVTVNETCGARTTSGVASVPIAFGTGVTSAQPMMLAVQSPVSLNGRFLQAAGVNFGSGLVIQTASNGGSISKVSVQVNGTTYTTSYNAAQFGYVLDSGQNIQLKSPPELNSVQIEAADNAGNSISQFYSPTLTTYPNWLVYGAGWLGPPVFNPASQAYEAGLQFPPANAASGASFAAEASNLIAEGIGFDTEYNLAGDLSIPVDCARPVVYKFDADRSVSHAFSELYGIKLGAGLSLSGDGTETDGSWQDCAISDSLTGTLSASADLSASKEFGFLELIGDVFSEGDVTEFRSEMEEVPVLSNFVDDILDVLGKVTLTATATGTLASDIQTQGASPYVTFQNVELSETLGLDIERDYGPEYWLATLAVEVDTSGSGTANFKIADPSQPVVAFDSVVLDLEAGVDIVVGALQSVDTLTKHGWAWEGTCTFPTPASGSHCTGGEIPVSAGQNRFQLIPHPASPNYAVFMASPQQKLALAQANAATQALSSDLLVSNIYPQAEVALAINPLTNLPIMLWMGDDLAKPVGGSHELYFSTWDGTNWSAHLALTNDNLSDQTPTVAWTNDGHAVAVWQRYSRPLTPSDTLETSTQVMELVSAVYTPASNTWSAPVSLTPAGTANSFPKLGRGSDGTLLLTWKQNNGTARRLMAAFYQSGAWGSPTAVVDGTAELFEWNAAYTPASVYSGAAATVAFTRAISPTGSAIKAQQLFTSTWNGSLWSAALPLVDGDASHRNPSLVYNATGQPLLLWISQDALHIRNLSTGSGGQTSVKGMNAMQELEALQDAQGDIMAVFTGREGQRSVYMAYYDQSRNQWGLPHRLTGHSETRENNSTAALDSTGKLWVGFTSKEMMRLPVTETLSNGKSITRTKIVPGKTDLRVFSYTPQHDLAFSASGLSVDTNHALPGSSLALSATIINEGDKVIDGVTVKFYDGDPATGGTLINKQSQNISLVSGESTTFSTAYPVTTETGIRTLYAVVSSDYIQAELDTVDNVVTRQVLGPDLQMEGAYFKTLGWNDVHFVATIRNIGNTTSPATTLDYFRRGPAQPILVSQVAPALKPGESITLKTLWNFGTLAVGEYDLVARLNTPGELNHKNDEDIFRLSLHPDLMVDVNSLTVTPLPSNPPGSVKQPATITATVYNISPFPATNVEVSFYNGSLDNGRLLFTKTIAELLPGSRVDVSGLADFTPCLVIAQIDPHNKLRDNNDNNLVGVKVRAGVCGIKYYFPVIGR